MPKDSDEFCDHRVPNDKEMLMSDAGLDQHERTILCVARYFFISFAEPFTQAWAQGITAAEDLPVGGSDVQPVALVLNVVHAMRSSRMSCFQFNCPVCPVCSEILSEQERQLMGTITALREGRSGTAHTHAMLLCEGNDTNEFLQSVQKLVEILPRFERVGCPRTLRPIGLLDAPVSDHLKLRHDWKN
ncbi:MAG: hypothetical protein AAF557_11240 [Pseudomonadota bacterium]